MAFNSFLSQSVTIQQFTEGSADGMGGYTAETWSALYRRVPAQLVLANRGESMQIFGRDKELVLADYFIYLEYRSGIEEGMQVTWKGRTFEIRLVQPWQEKGRYLKLAVVEKERDEG